MSGSVIVYIFYSFKNDTDGTKADFNLSNYRSKMFAIKYVYVLFKFFNTYLLT